MPEVVVAEFMDEAAVADLADGHDVHYDPTLVDRRGALLESPCARARTADTGTRSRLRVSRANINAAGVEPMSTR